MSFSDTIFLFFLALILFGPKKLPEMARQAGKLLAELRRASNEFRSQIESEIAHLEVEKSRNAALDSTASLPAAPKESVPRQKEPATLAESPTQLPADSASASAGTASSDSSVTASPDPSPEVATATQQESHV